MREPLGWGLKASRSERGFRPLARLIAPRKRRMVRCERSSERWLQLLDYPDSTSWLETGVADPTLQVRLSVALHRIDSHSPPRARNARCVPPSMGNALLEKISFGDRYLGREAGYWSRATQLKRFCVAEALCPDLLVALWDL